MSDTYKQELTIAIDAADLAGRVQVREFPRFDSITFKDDLSPVTEVDTRCEELIIGHIKSNFPDDAILSEESGEQAGTTGRTWVIDPLDGTRPYIRGIPTHSVLVALVVDKKPVVGVMYLPAQGVTYAAAVGIGASCNNRPIKVSDITEPKKAMGSALGFLETDDAAAAQKTLQIMKSWDYAYGFMDAYSYGLIAQGSLDVCINLIDKPWDCAAAACIIKEAGGTYSDIDGNESIFNGSFLASNGHLHDTLLKEIGTR